jgi:hypothetical protein
MAYVCIRRGTASDFAKQIAMREIQAEWISRAT